MTKRGLFLWIALVTLISGRAHAQPVDETQHDHEIVPLRGDLYQAREDRQYTVFLVTPDGIVVVDPLNIAFARWLKDQLATRFPGVAVRYVMFTHHHFDRAEGSSVFTGATMVGHGEYNQALSNSRASLPTFLSARDRNKNGRIDADEVAGSDAEVLMSRDRNKDRAITSNELYAAVYSVRASYGKRRTITLGGKHVELVHTGSWHSRDMTALFFPSERILFTVDPPPLTRIPFSFDGVRPNEIYDWLHATVALDFETAIFGDGTTMSHAQIQDVAEYLDELRDGVIRGYERGQTVQTILRTALPENYRGSAQYSGRAEQIANVYRTLSLRQVTLSGVTAGNYSRRAPSFCSSYSFCAAGGAVPAGTGAISLQLARKISVLGEVTFSTQMWSTRRASNYDEEVALRQTRTSALLQWTPVRYIGVSGGLSYAVGDARGFNIVRGQLIPAGGRHQISQRAARLGLAGGADFAVPLNAAINFVVPLRVVYLASSQLPAYWPGRIAADAGLGIRIRVARFVH
jgi:glyoxylase-like metal-dependent hydrolase (beta-lactamase superfamily II)